MKDINLLNPALQILCREWLAQCNASKIDARITETWRDPDREDQLHAQGITAATGKSCKHCCLNKDEMPASKAFDFAIFDADGDYIKNGTDPLYLQAGEIGEKIGLIWGGRWYRPDWDHFEIT